MIFSHVGLQDSATTNPTGKSRNTCDYYLSSARSDRILPKISGVNETVPRKKPQKFNIRSSCNKCGRWVYYPSPANREPGILNFSKLSLYRCTATNVARDDSGIIGDTMFIAAARFTPGFLLQALTLLCLQGSVWFPRVYSLSSTFPLALVPSACLPHIHRKLFPYALVISR